MIYIHLAVNLDFRWMENMCERILAHAATKSIPSLSSLSQTKNDLSLSSFFKAATESAKTFAHWLKERTCISRDFWFSVVLFAESVAEIAWSQERGLGGFRVFHKVSTNI